MKIIIEMDTDNVAFQRKGEVTRILRVVARQFEDWDGNTEFSLALRDSNGNQVGTAQASVVDRNKELLALAHSVNRVSYLTEENFPHRSPEWVYDHPETPIKLAMNNMLNALDKVLKFL